MYYKATNVPVDVWTELSERLKNIKYDFAHDPNMSVGSQGGGTSSSAKMEAIMDAPDKPTEVHVES